MLEKYKNKKLFFKRLVVALINYTIIFSILYFISNAKISYLPIIITIMTIVGTSIETLQIRPVASTRYYKDMKSKELLTITQSLMFAININIISKKQFIATIDILGCFIILIGLWLRIYSIRKLGSNFHSTVSTTNENTLITEGIYNFVRHPCYLGVIVISSGYTIVSHLNPLSIVSFLAVMAAVIYRLKIEEVFLTKVYGTEYTQYMKKTKKIIPYIY